MFMDVALSWSNDHSNTMGMDATHSLPWYEFKQMLIKEYFPSEEMQKLEQEL